MIIHQSAQNPVKLGIFLNKTWPLINEHIYVMHIDILNVIEI